MKILVASQADIKLKSVRRACGYPVVVDGRSTSSKVNEQPVGLDEVLRGVVNRMNQITVQPGYDYYVAIENGIEEVGPVWMDFAIVLMATSNGIRYLSRSTSVVFPALYVVEAQSRGFETTTVGSIIAEKLGGVASDPHLALTGVSREVILTQAIEVVLGQILNKRTS